MFYYYSTEIYTASGDFKTLANADRAVVADTARLIAEAGVVFRLLGFDRLSIAGSVVSGVAAIIGDATSNGNDIRILAGGSVIGNSGYTIALAGSTNSVVNAGTIYGVQGVSLTGSDSHFVNSGDIATSTEAVVLGKSGNTGSVSFTNSGSITSSGIGNAVAFRGGLFEAFNSGTIVSTRGNAIDLTGSSSALTLTNTGTIQARNTAVFTDSGVDVVNNAGTIIGDVNLLSGNDSYFGTGGVTVGTVFGASGDDVLSGGAGRDVLDGGSEDDEIDGAGGNDLLFGGFGIDTVDGGDGNDVLIGGGDGDALDGGAGRDVASYRTSSFAVLVDLFDASLNTGDAAGDSFAGIEVYQGSAFADQLFGSTAADTFQGGDGADLINGREGNDLLDGQDGDDVLIGGTGNDRLIGGAGIDTANYSAATALVRVNLTLTAAQNTAGAGVDFLAGIENLVGSAFADVLTGDFLANVIDGGDGADQIFGNSGDDVLSGGASDDRIEGGTEIDTVTYAAAASAITLNLSLTTAQATGGAGADTVIDVENIIGSAFNDVLTGSTLANVLTGGVGNDQLAGGDGDDVLAGGVGNDTLTGGIGNDTADYAAATAGVTVKLLTLTAQNTVGAGADTLAGIETLIGSAFNDTLIGDAAANTLDGGVGNDVLNGSGGFDTASYRSAAAGVTVDLGITIAQDTIGAGSDQLILIEYLTGSRFGDTLTGSNVVNRLEGLEGNDTLNGLGGVDTLIGGDGNDTLFGGADNDTLNGGSGTNELYGGSEFDTVTYADAAGGVEVDFEFATPFATDSFDFYDSLIDIEAVIGSRFGDYFNSGAGAQRFTGGLGPDSFIFAAGNANGDTIVGFSGTNEIDRLYFNGYGAGATFTQIDATHWQVSDAAAVVVEIITFIGGSPIVPAFDVVFG